MKILLFLLTLSCVFGELTKTRRFDTIQEAQSHPYSRNTDLVTINGELYRYDPDSTTGDHLVTSGGSLYLMPKGPRLYAQVWEDSGTVLLGVNELPTQELAIGDLVEFDGRKAIGDGGHGQAYWTGSSWEKIQVRPNRIADIWIIAGQSNSAGVTAPLNLFPVDYPIANLMQFAQGQVKTGNYPTEFQDADYGKIIPAYQPLHSPYQQSGLKIGWGFYAAKLHAMKNPNVDVVILSGSQGTTGFSTNHWGVGNTLHEGLKTKISDCLSILENLYDQVSIRAFCWHQGETDATSDQVDINNELVPSFQDFRLSFSTYGAFPIVLGTISERIYPAQSRSINQLIFSVPETLPNSIVVDIRDYPDMGDAKHFTAEAQRLIGADYYNGMVGLLERSNPFLSGYLAYTTRLSNLYDVDVSSAIIGDQFSYDGRVWQNQEIITNITNGLVLDYNLNTDLTETNGAADLVARGTAPTFVDGRAVYTSTASGVLTDAPSTGDFTRFFRAKFDDSLPFNITFLYCSDELLLSYDVAGKYLRVQIPSAVFFRYPIDLQDGQDHSVAFTYDADTGDCQLMVDGLKISDGLPREFNQADLQNITHTDVVFGGYLNSNNFVGEVDSIKLFDRVLSDQELEILTLRTP